MQRTHLAAQASIKIALKYQACRSTTNISAQVFIHTPHRPAIQGTELNRVVTRVLIKIYDILIAQVKDNIAGNYFN